MPGKNREQNRRSTELDLDGGGCTFVFVSTQSGHKTKVYVLSKVKRRCGELHAVLILRLGQELGTILREFAYASLLSGEFDYENRLEDDCLQRKQRILCEVLKKLRSSSAY